MVQVVLKKEDVLREFQKLTPEQQLADLQQQKRIIDKNPNSPLTSIFEIQKAYYESSGNKFVENTTASDPDEEFFNNAMAAFKQKDQQGQQKAIESKEKWLATANISDKQKNLYNRVILAQKAEYQTLYAPKTTVSKSSADQGAGGSGNTPDTSAPAESLGDKARKFGSQFMSAVKVSGDDPVTNMVNSGTDFVITGAGQLVSGAAAGLKTMHGTRGGRAVIREAGAGIAALIASAAFISPMLDKMGIGNIPIIGSLVKLVALGVAFLAARKGIHEAQEAYGPALADSQGNGNHLPNETQGSARNQQSTNGDTPVRINPANDNGTVATDTGQRIPTQLNPNDVGNRCAQSNDVSRPGDSGSGRPNIRFPKDCRFDGLACTGHTSGSGQPAEIGELVFNADGSLPPGQAPKMATGR